METIKKIGWIVLGGLMVALGFVLSTLTQKPSTIYKIGKQKIKRGGNINTDFPINEKKKRRFSPFKKRSNKKTMK